MESFFDSTLFNWLVLPLLIFTARIIDVTLGTMRIVFVSRGLKYLAPIVGFFEVIIWLLAIRVIMQNLNNTVCYIAYGAGFGLGTYIGMYIEKKMAMGRGILRIITRKDAAPLISCLRENSFGVTSLRAQGNDGEVHLLFMVIKRSDFNKITKLIQKYNPNAFYTLEDVCFVNEGIFPKARSLFERPGWATFRYFRKGK
jgi:uncharacterized protein YebE (UPF0316 family)